MKNKPAFSFDHPAGMHVYPSLPEASLRNFPEVKTRDMGTGHVWYDLPIFDHPRGKIFLSLPYHHGIIGGASIYLSFHEENDSTVWSQERELQRVVAIENWLIDIGYPPARYPWGVVWACADPKTGDGCGGVDYT